MERFINRRILRQREDGNSFAQGLRQYASSMRSMLQTDATKADRQSTDIHHRTGSTVQRGIELIEAAGEQSVHDFMQAYGDDFVYGGIDIPQGWEKIGGF